MRAGLQETLITTKTYVNPFPETSMLDTLPSLHCFGRLFSTYNRRAILVALCAILPLAFAVPHRPRGIASDIRHIRGSLCFMANCFIIFDIFPVYGRGSAFCFMAVYCTWWTSLYVPPWIIPRPTPGSCFIREMFVVSNMISSISSWQKRNLYFRVTSWKKNLPFDLRYKNVFDCLLCSLKPYNRLI